MDSILKRLATSGMAFQASSLLAGLLALFTLPLYTRSLTAAEFGYAETLLTLVILTSILLRAGLGEAFIRHWHEAGGDDARRQLVRTTSGFVLISSTVALAAGILLAEPLSELVLGTSDATLMSAGVFGIWAFTNLEMAYALLRVSDRRRAYRLRADSPTAAGLYSVAVKLATAVIILVRAFQLAWPPLAYSIVDKQRAQQAYARVTTAYMIVSSLLVAAFTLLGAWLVRLLTAPDFFAANDALPWLALGWALYGLYLVLVTIAGRAKVTVRTLPSAAAGLVVNVGLLIWLVPPLGVVGAAISLCVAYIAMLVVLFLLTRKVFTVPFEWRRIIPLVVIVAVLSVAGNGLLPSDGIEGLLERSLLLAAIAGALVLARVVTIGELQALRYSLRPPRL